MPNSRTNPDLLSLVLPIYNESEVIPLLRPQLTAFVDKLPMKCEMILIDDGSRDDSLAQLTSWAAEDHRVKVLGLARNFGHQAAATAGLDASAGGATIVMDADLQDPPDVILEMLAEYRNGYDVVYGQRFSRQGETILKRFTAWAFYRLMRTFVQKDLPPDSGDFRLISRPCLEALKSMRETHRFLRGMVSWVGFKQKAVKFERPPRAAGETKYHLFKMLKFAFTAAVSFSPAPLRFSFALGFLVSMFGMAIGVYAVYRRIAGLRVEPGWASIIMVVCFVGGGILINLGIVGEYIARIFEEVKGRPIYIVSTMANIESPDGVIIGVSAMQNTVSPPSIRGSQPIQQIDSAGRGNGSKA